MSTIKIKRRETADAEPARQYRTTHGAIDAIIAPGEKLTADQLEARLRQRNAKRQNDRLDQTLDALATFVTQRLAAQTDERRQRELEQVWASVDRGLGLASRSERERRDDEQKRQLVDRLAQKFLEG